MLKHVLETEWEPRTTELWYFVESIREPGTLVIYGGCTLVSDAFHEFTRLEE